MVLLRPVRLGTAFADPAEELDEVLADFLQQPPGPFGALLHSGGGLGDRRLTRRQQEELTQRAQAIIEEDRKRTEERFPHLPPTISIRECQEAIGIGGGIPMTLRGEERLITEVRTGGVGNPRWFSGGLRFTVTEQHRLTRLARAIIEESRKTKRQLPLPNLE